MYERMVELICKKRVKIAVLCFAIAGCSFSLQSQTIFESGGISYESITATTAKVVAGADEYSGNVVIPDTAWNGIYPYRVTGIDTMAFYYNEDLTSVKIPPPSTRRSSWDATLLLIQDSSPVNCSVSSDSLYIK